MSKAQVPEVTWAQRSSETEHEKNVVFLTVRTPDIVKPDISIDATKVSVSGADKHGKRYELALNLYAEIEPENTKQRHTDFNLYFVLQKKEDKAEYWPRLSSEKGKLHNVRTDFDKWVDEDEQDEKAELPDMNGMGGMGGMGGAGGPDLASMMGGAGMQGLDFSKLAGMGGAGAGGEPNFEDMMKGMGDDDEKDGDSDDEGPSLEEVKE